VNVTSQALLEGMWFALESCGEKVQAAGILFDRGDYGLSSAVAMAARDEFAKARLLRDLWRRGAGGGTVALDEVRAICGKRLKGVAAVSHLDKQRAAMVSLTLRDVPGLEAALERVKQTTIRLSALRDQGATINDPVH
jgi:hypothetical protein